MSWYEKACVQLDQQIRRVEKEWEGHAKASSLKTIHQEYAELLALRGRLEKWREACEMAN